MSRKPDRLIKEIRRISDTINRPDMDARLLRHGFVGERINSYMNGLDTISENFVQPIVQPRGKTAGDQRLY